MKKNVGETLQYDYKPKVTGYYELVQAVQTGTKANSFSSNEQLQTFDIASGARSINWKTFNVNIGLKLTFAGDSTGSTFYVKKSNSWISRVVLRSKVGRYAIDITECCAFSSTIPYRKHKQYFEFSNNKIHGDQMNDVLMGALGAGAATGATRWMQEDLIIRGLNAATTPVIEQVHCLNEVTGGIFDLDKDIALTTGFFLDIYLAPQDNVVYQILGQTAAYGGAPSTITGAVLGVTPVIDYLTCNFCQQADDQVNVGLLSHLSSGRDMIVPFDYLQCQTQTTGVSTSHQISQPITTNIGDKLKKIYYMVGLDNSVSNGYSLRYGETVFSATSSISQITLTLNNRIIGIYDISKKDHIKFKYGFPDLDDVRYKKIMDNGATTANGLKVVNNNFFLPIEIENLKEFEDEYDSNTGLPILSDANFTARVTLNGDAVGLKHYVWMVGTKYMHITSAGIEILP